jgi:hypothetical protein
MNVVRMDLYRCRETVALLEALLEKARAGAVVGVALCYVTPSGFEDALIAGRYSADGGAAAALRLSMRLAGSQGEYSSPP